MNQEPGSSFRPATEVDSPSFTRVLGQQRRGLLARIRSRAVGSGRGNRSRDRYAGLGIVADGGAFIPFPEDHLPGGRLQYRGYGNVHGLADHFARVIHHDHGAIVEIRNALVVLFSLFQDKHAHCLAGQDDRLQRVRQFVDVEDRHALKLRDFVQVEIVGDDLAFVELCEFDQFHVDFAHGRKVVFHNLNLEGAGFLKALKDVEPAATAVALERVRGIGDQLQLAQDELRNYDDAVEKARLCDIGNASINDDAGVEDLITL